MKKWFTNGEQTCKEINICKDSRNGYMLQQICELQKPKSTCDGDKGRVFVQSLFKFTTRDKDILINQCQRKTYGRTHKDELKWIFTSTKEHILGSLTYQFKESFFL